MAPENAERLKRSLLWALPCLPGPRAAALRFKHRGEDGEDKAASCDVSQEAALRIDRNYPDYLVPMCDALRLCAKKTRIPRLKNT